MTASPAFFILGADVQDTSNAGSMAAWQARGVNTLVRTPDANGAPPTADAITVWSQAAVNAGFYMMRQPLSTPDKGAVLTAAQVSANVQDAKNWNGKLLAWTMPDEPSNTSDGFNTVYYTPAELQALADQLRRSDPNLGAPNMPLFESHVGTHITPDWAPNVQPTWHNSNARNLMQDYMQGGEVDWLASDTYQIQNNQPLIQTATGPNGSGPNYVSTPQGISEDRQTVWSETNKPVMSYIATSSYWDNMPVPTPGEFAVQAWSSVIHGASGIIYFPVQLQTANQPWKFDATPPSVADAMTSFDHEITAISKFVMSAAGGTNQHTIYRSAVSGATPASGQLPYGFEATVIKDPTTGSTYKIILNMTNSTQMLDLTSSGLSNLAKELGVTGGKATFAPYEVMKGHNFITGTSARDALTGTEAGNAANTTGSDVLKGYSGADKIDGRSGSDSLFGGLDNDTLTGGAGADAFVFDTTPGKRNIDTITDFTPGTDTIRLDHLVFTGFNGQQVLGTLPESMFASGTKATTSSTHILYDANTGALLYDADGKGPSPATQIATLSNHPVLHASDFFLF